MTDSTPNPVDIHVGALVRLRRKAIGLSQTDLAEALGLTFQQVQKYERGTNRISASKLWHTAVALKVPIAYFFKGLDAGDGVTGEQAGEVKVNSFLRTAEGVELCQAFPTVRTPRLRRKVLELVKAMAVNDED